MSDDSMREQEPISIGRRSFLGGLAATGALAVAKRAGAEALVATLPPSAINVEKDPEKIRELTTIMLDKVNTAFGNDFQAKVDAVGYRISDAWRAADGFVYVAEQGAIWQLEPSGRLNIWNTLDQMHEYGLDAKLDSGELGVTVPPYEDYNDSGGDIEQVFVERARHFAVPQALVNFIQEFRKKFEVGVITSRAKPYGPYNVVRTQRMAFQEWLDGPNKGLIQRILVGDAARIAGLIPREVLLDKPDLGTGGRETTSGQGQEVAFVPGITYASSSGSVKLENFEGDSRGLSGRLPDSLDNMEARFKGFGTNRLSFVPDGSLRGGAGASFFTHCDGLGPDCRYLVMYRTYDRDNPDVSKRGIEIKYNFVADPGLQLSSEVERHLQEAINRSIADFVAEFANLDINDDSIKGLRRYLGETRPIRLATAS